MNISELIIHLRTQAKAHPLDADLSAFDKAADKLEAMKDQTKEAYIYAISESLNIAIESLPDDAYEAADQYVDERMGSMLVKSGIDLGGGLERKNDNI